MPQQVLLLVPEQVLEQVLEGVAEEVPSGGSSGASSRALCRSAGEMIRVVTLMGFCDVSL